MRAGAARAQYFAARASWLPQASAHTHCAQHCVLVHAGGALRHQREAAGAAAAAELGLGIGDHIACEREGGCVIR